MPRVMDGPRDHYEIDRPKGPLNDGDDGLDYQEKDTPVQKTEPCDRREYSVILMQTSFQLGELNRLLLELDELVILGSEFNFLIIS